MTTLTLAAAVLLMSVSGVRRVAYQPQERQAPGRRH